MSRQRSGGKVHGSKVTFKFCIKLENENQSVKVGIFLSFFLSSI